MDRIKDLFAGGRKPEVDPDEYEPLRNSMDDDALDSDPDDEAQTEVPFSWIEYFVFAMIGVAMLWAWNMFLAASPYFQSRFADNGWIAEHFQSAILSVSTTTNLLSMLILTNMQKSANYPRRINVALLLNIAAFSLLTISTSYFLDVSAGGYLAFLLLTVCCAAMATGLFQNGAFAFAASFGRPEYTQAIMAGQGVAGVLPSLAQMLSVLIFSPGSSSHAAGSGSGSDAMPIPDNDDNIGTAAFVYFLTAVGMSIFALVAFVPLVRRHDRLVESRIRTSDLSASMHSIQEAEQAARKVVGLTTLFKKLHWLAGAVFMCFAVAMFFPVFTAKILSVRGVSGSKLFQPAAFIPLAFFFWNLGDLSGRIVTMWGWNDKIRRRPVILFIVSVARLGFLPFYLLCNIRGRGAVISSDAFYLLLVQFPYGLTNGWLASNSMMGAAEWVDEGEREVAGGFMGLCLVAGLTTGSLLSFTVAGI